MTNTASKQVKKQEALDRLKALIGKGETVYTVLRSVSKSGMSRRIDFYVIKEDKPIWITGSVAEVLGLRYSMDDWSKQKGAGVSGCGMDMGFHCVHNLAIAVLCNGKYDHDTVYSVKQAWV